MYELSRSEAHPAAFRIARRMGDRLSSMENEGLRLSDEEFAVLLRYLARNFRQ